MCGLVGVLLRQDSTGRAEEPPAVVIDRMTAALVHRGPDATGRLVSSSIAMGHCRLSILDLTTAGGQPMRLRADGPVLVFNGEIYNFRELRSESERIRPNVWRGHSDTEVILHAYDVWGTDGLARLEGIFALALWDPALQQLVLMRDRLGVKPLYYGDSQLGLVFGSEIKAVLAAGDVDKTLDEQALREYLWFGNAHEDRTFYHGVRQLLPGHWLIARGAQVRTEPWFRIEEWMAEPRAASSIEHAAPAVQAALDAAVRRQLVADVPVGIFLSGGIDSTAIAASAVASGAAPRCFTATFDYSVGTDELPVARRIAAHLGLEHEHVHVGSTDLWPTLERLVSAHDEPFADAANIPLFLMAQAIHGRIKVVLQGDGGDELFAGYRRYAMLRNAAMWRCWPPVISPLVRRMGRTGERFVRMARAVGSRDPALRMARLLTTESTGSPPERLFNTQRRLALESATDPLLAYRRAAKRFDREDAVQQMLLTDLTVQLPCQFLPKVDRSTMAWGIEARVPMLDDQLARLVVGLPSNWKVHGTQKKVLLRMALRGRVPESILDAPKRGLTVPFGQWLAGPLYHGTKERILDVNVVERLGLDSRGVGDLIEQNRRAPNRHGALLWKLLQLALWQARSGML
jgi:asparagine synthase (glutamine-hydrolysing)